MKKIMKKILLMAMLLFTAFVCKAETLDGTAFLKSLNGTYIELFSSETCLNPVLSIYRMAYGSSKVCR